MAAVGIVPNRNGLVSFLSTCGPYAASQISTCDYGVMERVSGCGIMLRPDGDSPIENLTKGTAANYFVGWGIMGELWIRYTGDSPAFLSNVWQGMDDIYNTFAKDVTFLSTACYGVLTGISHNIGEGMELGGKDYGIVRFKVLIQDF